MSSLTCQCPANAALNTIYKVVCPESFGQIQKVAFQRLYKADGTRNAMVGSGTPLAPTITKKATWTALQAAVDSSKVVISPYINSPADSGGDARMTGGGNDDLGGIPQVLGGEPVLFNGSLRGVPQKTIESMEDLVCDANAGNLGVFLFDENGRIEAIQDPNTPTTFYPIPIRALYIAPKIHGNFDGKDSNAIQWYYAGNYSKGLVIITPDDFNPLTDLDVVEV